MEIKNGIMNARRDAIKRILSGAIMLQEDDAIPTGDAIVVQPAQQGTEILFNDLVESEWFMEDYTNLSHQALCIRRQFAGPVIWEERLDEIRTAILARRADFEPLLREIEKIGARRYRYHDTLAFRVDEFPEIQTLLRSIIDPIDRKYEKIYRAAATPTKMKPTRLGDLDFSGFVPVKKIGETVWEYKRLQYPGTHESMEWLIPNADLSNRLEGDLEKIRQLQAEGKTVLVGYSQPSLERRVEWDEPGPPGVIRRTYDAGTVTFLSAYDPSSETYEGDPEAVRREFIRRARYSLSEEPQYIEMTEEFPPSAQGGQIEPFLAGVIKASPGLVEPGGCGGYYAGINNKGEHCFVTAAHCLERVGSSQHIDTFYGPIEGTIAWIHPEWGPGWTDETTSNDVGIITVKPEQMMGVVDYLEPIPLAIEESPLGIAAGSHKGEAELIWKVGEEYSQVERIRTGYSGSPILNSNGEAMGLVSGIWEDVDKFTHLRGLQEGYRTLGLFFPRQDGKIGGASLPTRLTVNTIKKVFGGAQKAHRKPSARQELETCGLGEICGIDLYWYKDWGYSGASGIGWALGIMYDTILARLGGYRALEGAHDLMYQTSQHYFGELQILQAELIAQHLPAREIWNQLDERAAQIGFGVPLPLDPHEIRKNYWIG